MSHRVQCSALKYIKVREYCSGCSVSITSNLKYCLIPIRSGLTPENLMRYLAVAITHHSGEVRTAAFKFLLELYRQQVRTFLT